MKEKEKGGRGAVWVHSRGAVWVHSRGAVLVHSRGAVWVHSRGAVWVHSRGRNTGLTPAGPPCTSPEAASHGGASERRLAMGAALGGVWRLRRVGAGGSQSPVVLFDFFGGGGGGRVDEYGDVWD